MKEIKYKDGYGRKFASLRVSLTQACNFQCSYCVPIHLKLKKLPNELSAPELFELTSALVLSANIKRIRLTGGEPLIYFDLVKFLELLKKLDVEEKSLTTNGLFLSNYIDLLWDSGFRRLNISLDSLDKNGFKQISNRKGLAKVLNSIELGLKKGFSFKINVVPMKSINEEQILPLLDFCLERNIECRYIELMKMGHLWPVFDKYFISMEIILNKIRKKYNFKKVTTPIYATAQKFEIENKGFFGIIPNMSAPFCNNCDRLRLTSDGKVYGCISNTRNHSIRHLLTMNTEQQIKEVEKILLKSMESKQNAFIGATTYMQQLGG